MMDLKQLFTDDDAVSPVIGVILMVAITVILAAVIGAFVLNIGGNQEAAPQASFAVSYDAQGNGFSAGDSDNDSLNISHDGGGTVDATSLSATVSGATVDDLTTQLSGGSASAPVPQTSEWTESTSAGATLEISEDSLSAGSTTYEMTTGDDVILTWTSSSGENTQILFESTIP